MELLLPLLLLVVFYFLLIRPQQKQRRQMAEVQQSIEPGVKVMTGAGLIATVTAVEDDEIVLEVAPGVTNRYVRRAIVRVIPDEQPGDNPDNPGSRDERDPQHNSVSSHAEKPDGTDT